MYTRKILSIVILSLLGLCFLCALAKNAIRSKKACEIICSLSFFTALTLLTISQLIGEKEKYITDTDKCCCVNGVCEEDGCTEYCPDGFCQHKCIDHNLEYLCGSNVKPGIPICNIN